MNEQKIEILLWYLKSSGSLDLLIDGKLADKHLNFIKSLPYFYELDNFYLVHAGFDFSKKNPFKIRDSMLYMREMKLDKDVIKEKFIVHGHQPTYMEKIISRIEKRKQILPLDNGVCYRKIHRIYDVSKLGNLCCLNLDTFELIIQENIDIKTIIVEDKEKIKIIES
jgi:serine/threonine protein phosphatase 1